MTASLPWVLVRVGIGGIENRCGVTAVVIRQLDPPTHVGRHIRYLGEVKPASVHAFIVCCERFAARPVHAKDMIEVLSVIAIGMNYRASHVDPGQSSSNHMDTGLFQDFSNGTIRRILARVDHAGDRGPCVVIRALDQKHLLIADDHSRRTRQPQWGMSDVPTKLSDEFGNRHTQLSNRAVSSAAPCSAAGHGARSASPC